MSSRPWEKRGLKTHSEWLHLNFAIYSQHRVTNSLFQRVWNQAAFTTALKGRVPSAPRATPCMTHKAVTPEKPSMPLGGPQPPASKGQRQEPETGGPWEGWVEDGADVPSVWWDPKKPQKKLLKWEADWRKGPALQASDSGKAVIDEIVVLICLA